MTTLHVIRHGKAMAGAEQYDRLHTVGEAQSRLLGQHLQRNAVHFDAVYCGPLTRQLDTLAHMRDAAGDVGAAWPPAVIMAELSEAPIEAVARHCMTERLATDPELTALMGELFSGKRGNGDTAFFETILAHAVRLWLSGEVTLPGVETAPEFGRRVRAGLDNVLRSGGEGRHIAVVTSNGVIGWLAGYAKSEAEPERECLFRRLFNASVSRFHARSGQLELSAWNVIEHLGDPQMRTTL
ncbi:MAG TPA: histidine phosphatase family protein [Polyangiaceae bacterium]|nr:histidine phosphatase family protein [Polyangiaceae bacterium]